MAAIAIITMDIIVTVNINAGLESRYDEGATTIDTEQVNRRAVRASFTELREKESVCAVS